MWVLIVTPAARGSRTGNETTSNRWRSILEQAGHRVDVTQRWDGEACDLLIALHAHKSRDSIRGFHEAHPARPLIVALTGTDVYGDLTDHPETWDAVSMATRLVVLQPLALAELPLPARPKTRVIYQSLPSIAAPRPAARATFDVCVLAHLRAVKDPFRTALAARDLPETSRIRVLQVGGALDEGSGEQAERERQLNPRYVWMGSVDREEALRVLAASDLMVNSSLREGGANVVGESLRAGVPVLASAIPGNLGLLGEDYLGYFPAGDTRALTALLTRAETDPMFLKQLRDQCRVKEALFEPAREAAAWRELIEDVVEATEDAQEKVEALSQAISEVGRVDVRAQSELELWPREPAGASDPIVVPVEVEDLGPDAVSVRIPEASRFDREDVAMVSMRVPESDLRLPGRILWNRSDGEPAVRLELYLATGASSARSAYADWVMRLLRDR